jgi:hypothetical protein
MDARSVVVGVTDNHPGDGSDVFLMTGGVVSPYNGLISGTRCALLFFGSWHVKPDTFFGDTGHQYEMQFKERNSEESHKSFKDEI